MWVCETERGKAVRGTGKEAKHKERCTDMREETHRECRQRRVNPSLQGWS